MPNAAVSNACGREVLTPRGASAPDTPVTLCCAFGESTEQTSGLGHGCRYWTEVCGGDAHGSSVPLSMDRRGFTDGPR